jgi:hypothetical protein
MDSSVTNARHLTRKMSKVLTPLSTGRSLTKRRLFCFSELSCSRLERVFGRRNALCAGAERDQILEECAKVSALCGTRKLLVPTRGEPAPV